MIARALITIAEIVVVLVALLFITIAGSYYLSDRQKNIRHRTPRVSGSDCTRTIVMDLTYTRSDDCWVVERCKSTETYESIYHGKELKECSNFLSTHPSGGGMH